VLGEEQWARLQGEGVVPWEPARSSVCLKVIQVCRNQQIENQRRGSQCVCKKDAAKSRKKVNHVVFRGRRKEPEVGVVGRTRQ